MAGNTTQKSIAASVGVSERTMHSWIKDNGWNRLRHASRTAPAIIAENMFSQVVELQNDIASREEGKRYPTMQEAELTRKLCLSIDRMKSAPALSQSMQVLRLFRTFAQTHFDRKFHLQLNLVIEHFLEGEAKNGYFPYQIEYGADEPIEAAKKTTTESGEGEMKEHFTPAKEGQINEERSLIVNQGGNDRPYSASPAQACGERGEPGRDCSGPPSATVSAHSLSPVPAGRAGDGLPLPPEANRKKFPESQSHKAFEPTSGAPSHQQKPEVNRKPDTVKAPRIFQRQATGNHHNGHNTPLP